MNAAPAATVLAIDTATELLSIALLTGRDGEQRRYIYRQDAGLKHGSNLLPVLDWMLKQAQVRPAALGLVVCCDGPGSFTGLRIGLATAKGLAAAAGARLVVVPTLDALAWPQHAWPGIVVTAIDARKQRFYSALYRSGRRLSGDLDTDPGTLSSLISETALPHEPIVVTGPAALQLYDRIRSGGSTAGGLAPAGAPAGASGHAQRLASRVSCDPAARSGAAAALLELGLARADRGEYAPDSHGPHYVRVSDAEMGITTPRHRS